MKVFNSVRVCSWRPYRFANKHSNVGHGNPFETQQIAFGLTSTIQTLKSTLSVAKLVKFGSGREGPVPYCLCQLPQLPSPCRVRCFLKASHDLMSDGRCLLHVMTNARPRLCTRSSRLPLQSFFLCTPLSFLYTTSPQHGQHILAILPFKLQSSLSTVSFVRLFFFCPVVVKQRRIVGGHLFRNDPSWCGSIKTQKIFRFELGVWVIRCLKSWAGVMEKFGLQRYISRSSLFIEVRRQTRSLRADGGGLACLGCLQWRS
jgi:hypothetical protein